MGGLGAELTLVIVLLLLNGLLAGSEIAAGVTDRPARGSLDCWAQARRAGP